MNNCNPDLSRLAVMVPSLVGGGAERVVIDLVNRWQSLGHAPTLLLCERRGELLPMLDPAVRVHSFDTNRVLRATLPLARWLRAERPPVLMSVLDHTNIIAVAAASTIRVPVVCTVHNMVGGFRNSPSRKERLLARLAGHAYARADRVVAVSDAVAHDLVDTLSVPAANVSTIPNPVNLERLMNGAKEEPSLVYPDGPRVVAMGRLESVKGYDLLLKAYQLVHKRLGGSLTIFGTGTREPHLKQLVHQLGLNNVVRFPGFHPNPWATARTADLIAISSHEEGFGLVIVEALAFGRSVVSTCADGAPGDLLEQGRLGTLVRTRTPQAFAEGMFAALKSVEDDGSRARKASQFGLDSAAQAYLDVLQTSLRRTLTPSTTT